MPIFERPEMVQPRFCYVLTTAGRDLFADMTYASVAFLRYAHPEAEIICLCDAASHRATGGGAASASRDCRSRPGLSRPPMPRPASAIASSRPRCGRSWRVTLSTSTPTLWRLTASTRCSPVRLHGWDPQL